MSCARTAARAGDQLAQLLGLEALQPRPQRHVRVRRHLRLHPDEPLDHVQRGAAPSARAVPGAPAARGSARASRGRVRIVSLGRCRDRDAGGNRARRDRRPVRHRRRARSARPRAPSSGRSATAPTAAPRGARLARYVRAAAARPLPLPRRRLRARHAASEFERNYDTLYGALAPRTDPVIGNHEYARRARATSRTGSASADWDRGRARHRAYVDDSGWQLIAYSSESDPRRRGRVGAQRRSRATAAPAGSRSGTAAATWSPTRCTRTIPTRSRSGPRSPAARRSTWSATTTSTAGSRRSTASTSSSPAPAATSCAAAATQRHRVAAAQTGVATATRLALRRRRARLPPGRRARARRTTPARSPARASSVAPPARHHLGVLVVGVRGAERDHLGAVGAALEARITGPGIRTASHCASSTTSSSSLSRALPPTTM